MKRPKILVVARNVWDDSNGISSTLSNLFQKYNPEDICHLYIESLLPNTKYCDNFFQISEYSLIKKIFKFRFKVSRYFTVSENTDVNNCYPLTNIINSEQKKMNFVRKNRSIVFSYAREFLWLLNGWKNKELKDFIKTNDHNVIFLMGSPLILMNRLQYYIVKKTDKPVFLFLNDDILTYKHKRGAEYLYKYFLYKAALRLINKCTGIYVISPKMKREYDALLNIETKILTKGGEFSVYNNNNSCEHIKIVYAGQLIYGRDFSLIKVIKALKQLNNKGYNISLDIYTVNEVSTELKSEIEIEGISRLMKPVKNDQVKQVLVESDILLFIESMDPKMRDIARLSFSTKLTDYFEAARCIFAIGPSDIAPIEYLKETNIAVVCTEVEQIETELLKLCVNRSLIREYGEKSFNFGKLNHNIESIDRLLLDDFAYAMQKKASLSHELQ